MNNDRPQRARALVVVANVIFAGALVVRLFGHWQAALVVIGVGLVPAAAAEVVRRKTR